VPHSNANLLRKGYDAYNKGDANQLADLFADDVVIHVQGRSPLAGDHQGKNGLRFLFSTTKENVEEDSMNVQEVAANDDFAVAVLNTSGKRKGKKESANAVHVFRLEGGKVAEAWYHTTEDYPVEEFWQGVKKA
jgi:uncharacterized protein